MIRLDDFRRMYPQYGDRTDYELTKGLHETYYAPYMSLQDFAAAFGGPTEETDPDTVEVRAYNERHPDAPIQRQDVGKGSFLSDMGHSTLAGLNEFNSLPFWLAEKGSEAVGLDWLAEKSGNARKYYQNLAKAHRDVLSAEQKLANEAEFFPKDKDGNTSFGDAWSRLPRKIGGITAESLPGMVAGMAGGAAIAGNLIRLGVSRGLAWGIGGALGEGSVAGAQDSQDVYDTVMTMPGSKLEQSPEYQFYLEKTGNPDAARKALANDISLAVGLKTGTATAALSAGPSAMFGKLIGGEGGKSLWKNVGKQAFAEGVLEEAPQSGAEQYLMQKELQRVDSSINPMEGVGEAAMGGVLAGAAMGGGLGALGHAGGRRAQNSGEASKNAPGENILPSDLEEQPFDMAASPSFAAGDATPSRTTDSQYIAAISLHDILALRNASYEQSLEERATAILNQRGYPSEASETFTVNPKAFTQGDAAHLPGDGTPREAEVPAPSRERAASPLEAGLEGLKKSVPGMSLAEAGKASPERPVPGPAFDEGFDEIAKWVREQEQGGIPDMPQAGPWWGGREEYSPPVQGMSDPVPAGVVPTQRPQPAPVLPAAQPVGTQARDAPLANSGVERVVPIMPERPQKRVEVPASAVAITSVLDREAARHELSAKARVQLEALLPPESVKRLRKEKKAVLVERILAERFATPGERESPLPASQSSHLETAVQPQSGKENAHGQEVQAQTEALLGEKTALPDREQIRAKLSSMARTKLVEMLGGEPKAKRPVKKAELVEAILSKQFPVESTNVPLDESSVPGMMEAQNIAAQTVQEVPHAGRGKVRDTGRNGGEGSDHASGLLQGDGGGHGGPAHRMGDGRRGDDGERTAQPAPERRDGGQPRQPVGIKIPNRADEPAHYELLEADDVRASHLPARGFQKNPAYGLENERRYHDEPASQAKVMENAARLDPAFLMDSVDANHGAPVVDQDNNVLGGNGRAMSIARAYESFPERGGRYREALKANAGRLGIDSAQVDAMRAPVLVRRLERGLSREERQGLVTAMNDDFKDARERRASGKSRGDRFGRRTLDMLAAGLKEAESLRQYFDTSASAPVVERMMRDGVIQPSERNALVGGEGLLNPDGKKVVEEALRGRVARSYEALAKLPADVVGKLDAAIPHILVAESIGKPWDITEHVKASVDLLADFKSSGSKDADLYLKQLDMRTGRAPVQDYTKQAIALFRMALDAKKGEYVKAFEKYASNAKMSPEAGGMPGVAKPQHRAFRESFRMEEEVIQSKPEKVKEGKPQAKEASKGQPPEDAFGTAFPAFSGKPHEAIEHLMKVREGHVPAAFYKEGLGDIDLPWGKEGKGGFGLAHIIERRNQSGMDGEAFARSLSALIREGRVERRPNYPGRAYIVSEKAETAIRLEWDGKRRNWIVTAYPLNKEALGAVDGLRTSVHAFGDKQPFPLPHSGGGEKSISSEKQAVNSEHSTFLADRHRNLYKSLLTGKATLEDYRRGFSDLLENEEAVRAELSGLTAKDLLKRGGPMFAWRHKGDKKADLVDALYRDMLSDFTLGQPYSVSGFMGMGAEEYRKATEASIRKIVDAQTEQTLADFAKSMAEQRQEYASRRKAEKEAVENPKTLDDFRSFMRFHMDEGKTASEARDLLSFEQRERFDRLAAEAGRSSRKTKAEPVLSSASQTTDGEIIATKHTQKGHDLFVVRLEDRVSREDYLALLSSAKKLGGYYSKFRGKGAVPGFQFTEREQAEAFLKLAQGDKADAQEAARARRDAFEDDRSQTAVQRLHEMADRLDEDADASLNAARKVNTAKRARQAASADATAYANKSLARTMRNIARAIEEGTATFLDRVREKRQVELLRDDLRLAKWEEAKAEYSTWDEREKHRGEPATSRTVEYAAFPHYRLYRSGWAELGRKLIEKDGTKNLGKKILSVADDVTETYLEFARGHLEDVSAYATRDGNPAVFKSREDAEKAIARNGYRGKAVVLPVKRGENRIILSPSAAQERGVWEGDDDGMITLRPELVDELFDKLGNASRDIPWQLSGMRQKRKALARMGIETPAEYRTALREFIGLQEEPRQDKVRELERTVMRDAVKTRGWLDFFPTPAAVTEEMLAAADIRPGMAVLEPSAGMGHIADRIREKGVEPVVAELEPQKRELLEVKGYEVVGKDFMEVVPEEGGYDRIVMNPPFSKRQDTEHVRRAYDLLKPGGRLVAIVSEGSFFGKDRKAAEFREWLEEVGGTSEKLAEGSFNDPALPVTMGVNTRMVIIDKTGAGPLASLKAGGAQPSDSTPVAVVEVDSGIVPEFKKARDLAKWLKEYFADKREETILSTGKKVRFGNGNLEASIKRVREAAHNQAYAGLNDLVRRAEYDSFEAKDARHPNLGGQEVYYSALRIGDTLYAVKFKMDVPSELELQTRRERRGEKNIEDLRYKDHALREIEIAPVLYREPAHNKVGFTQATGAKEIAPVLYRGVGPDTGGPTQATEAIREISLGVLRDAVKPSRLENGVLSSVKPGEFLNEVPPSRLRVRRAAVQSVADALGKRAANAADTRVIQSFEELPKAVRDVYGPVASQVEGIYDTETDTVYLVADNLRSPARAAEVWMHENMVHHGLRGLFGVAETRRLLNRLWQGMGGMGNADIAAIARRYGVDPRSDTQGRALVMEEYLASLAEKRAADKLTGQDKTYWRRFVDAVLRAWHALVDAVTGRTGSMKYENVDRLLSALDRYVFEGKPDGMAEGGMVPAMASVDKPGSDMEAAHAAWEQVHRDAEEWERQVDAFRPHQGTGGRQPRLMTVCRTPDVLQKLGAPDLPMTMTADNLGKVLSDKVDHGLPKELVKQLPRALAEPIMVFESASQADSFVVLTELKHEGRSVMAAVHLDTEKQRVRVNDIASAYKRSNEAWYTRQVEEGRLLYQDKKKSLAWARTNRLQLPRVRKLPARLRKNRILTEEDVVKPIAPDAKPLASLGKKPEVTPQTPIESFRSKIGGHKPTFAERFSAFRKNWKRRLEQEVFDHFASIKDVSKQGYLQARMTTSLGNQVESMIKYGAPVWKDGVMGVEGKSLQDIFSPVAAEMDSFLGWMVARRASRLAREGRERLFTPDEISAALKLKEGQMPDGKRRSEVYEKVFDDFAVFKKRVLDFSEQGGIINPDSRKVWENADYIPFYRVKEGMEQVRSARNKNGLAGQDAGIKRLTGSDEHVGDPLENIMRNFAHLVDAAQKNLAAKLILDDLYKAKLATKLSSGEVTAFRKVEQGYLDEAMKPTAESLPVPFSLTKAEQNALLDMPGQSGNTVSVQHKGVSYHFTVDDPLLFNALTGVWRQQGGNGAVMAVLRKMRRALTTGVTVMPDFIIRNFLRDTLHTWTIEHQSGFKPLASSLAQMHNVFRVDEDTKQLLASGSVFMGSGYRLGSSSEEAAKALTRVLDKQGKDKKAFEASVLDTPKKFANLAGKIWETYERAGSAAENAARLAVYKKLRAKGVSHREASFAAKDLMDFTMRGQNVLVQFLCDTVPFLGARLAGLHRLGRGAMENPRSFAVKGLTISLASMALYALNAALHPDEWDALEDWEKDTYFHFWVGEEHFQLPKPFEVGFLFGTVPERIMEQLMTDKPGRVLAERVVSGVLEQLQFNPIPQAVRPLAEQWFNKDIFRDRPIVSQGMERKIPVQQYGQQTTATAKLVAQFMDTLLTPLAGKTGLDALRSPARLEHLLKGYLGGLGMFVLGASDMVINKVSNAPDTPERRLEDYPVIGAFYRGSGPRRTRYESELYEIMRTGDALYSSLKQMAQEGENAGKLQRELGPDDAAALAARKGLHSVTKEFAMLNKAMEKIKSSRNLSASEKRRKLDNVQRRKNMLAQHTYKKIERMRETVRP